MRELALRLPTLAALAATEERLVTRLVLKQQEMEKTNAELRAEMARKQEEIDELKRAGRAMTTHEGM